MSKKTYKPGDPGYNPYAKKHTYKKPSALDKIMGIINKKGEAAKKGKYGKHKEK